MAGRVKGPGKKKNDNLQDCHLIMKKVWSRWMEDLRNGPWDFERGLYGHLNGVLPTM